MKRFKSIVIAACAVLIAVVATLPALPAAAASDSSSLSIVPKKTYLIEPGKSVKDTLIIHNLDSNSSLQLTLKVIDFTYLGDGGTPKLILDPNAPQTTWSLKPYLTLPETVTIPAGGTSTVNMSVAIPANVGAGSYYSAILYSTGAPSGGNVGLSASGVTLVFATVPGQVNEKLTLEKFGGYKISTTSAISNYYSFTGDMPYNIGYTLKNDGNVAESPVGTITLRYMFGQKTTIDNVNTVNSLALIGQTRTFTACIKTQAKQVDLNGAQTQANSCINPGLWPGLYTTSLDLFYGQNGNLTQEVVGNGWFWYLPVWFIVVFFVVLAILAFVVWRLVVRFQNMVNGRKMRRSLRRRR